MNNKVDMNIIPHEDSDKIYIRTTMEPDWGLINGMASILKRDIEEGRVVVIRSRDDSKD